MKPKLRDTDPAAQEVHLRLLREAPGWRKLQLVDDLNRALRLLALSGLKQQYPQATERELRRRLAERLFGRDLAERAFGPMPRE